MSIFVHICVRREVTEFREPFRGRVAFEFVSAAIIECLRLDRYEEKRVILAHGSGGL
jgi:hypothetical protein